MSRRTSRAEQAAIAGVEWKPGWLYSHLTLSHCPSTQAWNWPFCPQPGLAGTSPCPLHLLHHRLWAPCIMCLHQNQVCLPGPPCPAPGMGFPTHNGCQVVLMGLLPWVGFLPILESCFLLGT